jgi:hypothetical protein
MTDHTQAMNRLAHTKRTAGLGEEQIEEFAEIVAKMNSARKAKIKKRTADRDEVIAENLRLGRELSGKEKELFEAN